MSSKIKVDTIENVAGSGNVSLGSGHNLVVPGTVSVTGASTLTGTTTIGNGTSGVAKINGGSSSSGQIIFMDAGTNRARIGVPTGTTTLSLSGSNTLTGDIVIDVDGRVTMPSQPSWFQYVIGSGTFSSGWKNVPLNPNASTDFPYHIAGGVTTANANHEVTVPVAGHYQINGAVTLDSGSVNTDGTLTLSKNNSTMGGGQSSGVYNGALGGTTISYVVELAANDTIGLDYYFSGSATYRNTQYAGYFSGYLLG